MSKKYDHFTETRIKIPLLCIATALATTISATNFSERDGFFDDPLNSQNGWSAHKTWNVNADGGFAFCSKKWARAVQGAGRARLPNIDDETTIRIEFELEGSVSAVNTCILRVGFENTISYKTGEGAYFFINSRKDKALQLRTNNNKNELTPPVKLAFPIEEGDRLAIEYSLQIGSSAETSALFASLKNITQNKRSDIGSFTGIGPEVYAAARADGVYPSMSLGPFAQNEQTVTGVKIYSVQTVAKK